MFSSNTVSAWMTQPAQRAALGAMLVIIFLMAVFPQRVNDTWTHLSVGRYIYEHHTVPSTEVFLYPLEGREVSYSEWLFGLMIYGVYKLGGGMDAVILFKAAIITLAFYMFYLAARIRGVSAWTYIPLALCTAVVMRFRFLERPETVTYLFLGVSMYLFERHRVRGGRLVFLVPVMQVVWANMHPASTLGVFVAGVYAASAAYEGYLADAKGANLKPLLAVFILTALATLVTPFPLEPFRMTFEVMAIGELKNAISETGPITQFPMFLKEYLVICAAWGAMACATYQRGRKLQPRDIAFFVIFAVLPLSSLKALSVFVLFAMVQLADGVERLAAELEPKLGVLAVMTAIIPLAVVLFIDRPPAGVGVGLGVARAHYPAGAVQFINQTSIEGNIFNLFQHGGYMSFNLSPARKVFIDDRLTSRAWVWDNAMQYNKVAMALDGWREVLDEKGVTLIVASGCFWESAMTYPLVEVLYSDPDWALVYAGEDGFVYLRNTEQLKPYITRYGLPRRQMYAELVKSAHLMADHPAQSMLELTLGKAYLRLGRGRDAKAAFQKWLTIAPGDIQAREALDKLAAAGY